MPARLRATAELLLMRSLIAMGIFHGGMGGADKHQQERRGAAAAAAVRVTAGGL